MKDRIQSGRPQPDLSLAVFLWNHKNITNMKLHNTISTLTFRLSFNLVYSTKFTLSATSRISEVAPGTKGCFPVLHFVPQRSIPQKMNFSACYTACFCIHVEIILFSLQSIPFLTRV